MSATLLLQRKSQGMSSCRCNSYTINYPEKMLELEYVRLSCSWHYKQTNGALLWRYRSQQHLLVRERERERPGHFHYLYPLPPDRYLYIHVNTFKLLYFNAPKHHSSSYRWHHHLHPSTPQPHSVIILRSAETIHSPLFTVLTLIALCRDQTASQCFLCSPRNSLWHLTLTERGLISHTSDRYLVWCDKSQI